MAWIVVEKQTGLVMNFTASEYVAAEAGQEKVWTDRSYEELEREMRRNAPTGKKPGRIWLGADGALRVDPAVEHPQTLVEELAEIARESGKKPQDPVTFSDIETVKAKREERVKNGGR